jgi:hypothetical protein
MINQGVILVYTRFASGNVFPVPSVINYGATSGPQSWAFNPVVGTINIKVFNTGNVLDPFGGTPPGTGNQYRYVLIPGGVAGGRGVGSEIVAELKGHLYTITELRAMPYGQIVSLLNLPQ